MIDKAKWIRIGDYIEVYDRKNTDGIPYPFYGINKDKTFMPTVADTNELDNTKYKIVSKGVFVFSGMQTGRDLCIRIAAYNGDTPILVSPAYTTFKVKDTNEVLPLYLFLQFNRLEMDRYGWFLSDGSIRSNLDWGRFCDIRVPLPSISVQRKLVDTYNGLKALAEQNEALIPKLSAACQAYIVDCRAKYPIVSLGDYIEQSDERNSDAALTVADVQGISTDKRFIPTKANMDGVSVLSYKIVAPSEFVYVADTSRRGDKMALALNSSDKNILVSSIYTVFCSVDKDVLLPEYLFLLFNRPEFDRYARFNSWGSARETFDWSEMKRVQIPLPPIDVQQAIVDVYHCMERAKQIAAAAREKLKTLCPALVQRAAHS